MFNMIRGILVSSGRGGGQMGQETLYFEDIIAYPMEWALMNLPAILTQG